MIVKRHILIRKILELDNRFQIIHLSAGFVSETHESIKKVTDRSTLAFVYEIVEKVLQNILDDKTNGSVTVDINSINSVYNRYMLQYIDANFIKEENKNLIEE